MSKVTITFNNLFVKAILYSLKLKERLVDVNCDSVKYNTMNKDLERPIYIELIKET